MRAVSRPLFRILNNEKLQPVQLLELRLLGTSFSSALRFTDAGEAVTFDGEVYQPVSFSRGEVTEILSSEPGDNPLTTVSFANIDSRMADLLNGVELEGANATLRLSDRRLIGRGDSVILAMGEVREPQLTESTLILNIAGVMSMLERITVPRRLWQSNCNYTFGSRACGVNLAASPFSIEGTIQSGTTTRALVVPETVLAEAGFPDDPTEFWAAGYVVMRDGTAATQARPFMRFEIDEDLRHIIYVRTPFLRTPQPGDTFIVRRGCRKTLPDCKQRQGDYLNYGGFAYVPYGRFDPDIIYYKNPVFVPGQDPPPPPVPLRYPFGDPRFAVPVYYHDYVPPVEENDD